MYFPRISVPDWFHAFKNKNIMEDIGKNKCKKNRKTLKF